MDPSRVTGIMLQGHLYTTGTHTFVLLCLRGHLLTFCVPEPLELTSSITTRRNRRPILTWNSGGVDSPACPSLCFKPSLTQSASPKCLPTFLCCGGAFMIVSVFGYTSCSLMCTCLFQTHSIRCCVCVCVCVLHWQSSPNPPACMNKGGVSDIRLPPSPD